MRTDRLLRGMHQVISHDLPNQLVAVQGLLQLLSLEEAGRLSEDGREYLRRLHNATRRGAELTRFLKEMERLGTYAPQLTTIVMTALARELQGALQQRFPTKVFEFAWHWNESTLVGDSRVISQALQELLAGLLHPSGNRCQVSASSQRKGKSIELAFALQEAPASPAAYPGSPPFEQRLEILLAREWLALLDATIDVTSPSGVEMRFSVLIPNQ